MATDEPLAGPGTSKQHKQILHLNFREKMTCRKEHQNLDSQKKAFDKQINKEELEMKQLLQRLHMVRSSASHTDAAVPGVGRCPNLDDSLAVDGTDVWEPQTCTNPYPISFKTMSHKERRRTVSGCEVPKWRRSLSGDKRESEENESAIPARTTRRSLPVIKSARLPLFRSSSLGCPSYSGDPGSSVRADLKRDARHPRKQLPGGKQKLIPVDLSSCYEGCVITPRHSLESPVSPLPVSDMSIKGRTIIRHLSLKECGPVSRPRVGTSEWALSPPILEKISRPRSLPNVCVETSRCPSPIAEIFTFPGIKASVLPFLMSQGEKDLKPSLKRRQSSKRSRLGSRSGNEMVATDQSTSVFATTRLSH